MNLARTARRTIAALLAALLAAIVLPLVGVEPALADMWKASTEVTYKEYWVPHSQYDGGCPETGLRSPPPMWYTEPGPCTKNLTVNLPDGFANAIKVEVYMDLWREARSAGPVARFKLNNGIERAATVGNEWSRSPYVVELPKSEFVQGNNTFSFRAVPSDARFHIHDLAIRAYYDDAHPLTPGSGSDVTAPTGQLTQIGSVAPSAGGTLNVDTDTLTLKATASSDAKYVDFMGRYDGYDEDIDGRTLDWHGLNRNNWNPGGTLPKATGGMIDHIGTVPTTSAVSGVYTTTWSLPEVPNQSGVQFKIRVVDAAGNVREAAGGPSASFTLARSVATEVYRIPSFQDIIVHHAGDLPDKAEYSIDLPDLTNVTSVLAVGQFWENPFLSINGNTPFKVFSSTCQTCGEDTWSLSKRSVALSQLQPGANKLTYIYNPSQTQFGEFIEKPGPMFVIKRATGTGAPVIVNQPRSRTVPVGTPVTFAVAAKGASPITYQWQRNGVAISGATGPTLAMPAAAVADNQATYRVVVTNGSGSVTSSSATLTVAGAGPWYDQQWDFRVPLAINANGYPRADAVVEAPLNLTTALRDAGATGAVDPTTIKVVEVNGAGDVVDETVTSQFEPATTFDATTSASGNLVFRAEGAWGSTTDRLFHVYFDLAGSSAPRVPEPALVTVADDNDEGQASFRITTPNATYQYQKQGGSLSSLTDVGGNDWLAYGSATGSAGQFRGMPNFPYPEGHFHPGFTTAVTDVVFAGPVRVVLRSTSTDGLWSYTTAFGPDKAVSTVTKIDKAHKYWFLYEGPIGGEVDSGDVIIRGSNTTTSAATSWSGDIQGDEWVAAADPADGRSFYVAANADDGFADSYFLLENNMAVVGLGRNNVNGTSQMLINENGLSYSFGFVPGASYGAVKDKVNGSYKQLLPATGLGQRDLGPPLGPNLGSLTVSPTATGAQLQWTSAAPTRATIDHGPDTSYGATVTDANLATSHTATIAGLACATTYHFRLTATDAQGRSQVNPDGTFRTAACTPVGRFASDDFTPAPLNGAVWNAVDPVGGSTVMSDGSNLVLDVTGGVSHDLWTTGDKSVRAMQDVTGIGDLSLEAKFLDVPKQNDKMTGFLFEESPSKWLRFDFLYNSNQLKTFAATVENTTGTTRGVTNLPNTLTGPLWMRVTRTGTTWTMSWSSNGTTFTQASSFSYAANLMTAGVFAANHNATATSTPAFTSRVAYVNDTANPVAPEGGPDTTAPEITGIGFSARTNGATVSWTTNEPATSVVQRTSAPDATAPGATLRHSVDLADLACGTAYDISVHSVDEGGNGGTVTGLRVFTSACGASMQSDEFNGTTLDPHWVVFSPVGDVPAPRFTGTNLVMDLPGAKVHDLVAPAFAAHRLLQYAPNTDFEIEEKWDTVPSSRFQNEGVIVQADTDDFLRFEAYHNGSQLRLFAGTSVNGTLTTRLDIPITASSTKLTLRVKRVGDQFTLSYAAGAGALTQAVQFTHSLVVADIGPFIANSNPTATDTPAFGASLDWFHVLPYAGTDDDDTTAPVISNITVVPDRSLVTVQWDTDEPATSVVDYGTTTAYGQTVTDAKKVLHHSVLLLNLPCDTDHHLRIASADLTLTTQSADQATRTTACPAIQSDSFNSATLDPRWRFIDPKGDVPAPTMTGTQLVLNLPAGSTHDLWQSALQAPRVLQAAPNQDFEIETRWSTVPTADTTSEGLLAMRDPTNFIRFDVFSNGSQTRAFAATFVNGAPTVRANALVAPTSAVYQRMTRVGNQWTLKYSPDGVTWSTLVTFSFTLGINDVGVFALNSNATGPAPAWSPSLDYFSNTASPATPDDLTGPVITGPTATESNGDAIVTWTTDEPSSSRVEYGATTSYGQIANDDALVTSHSLTISQVACDTTIHLRVRSVDVHGNATTSPDSTFTAPSCGSGIQSDAFQGTTLHPRWTFLNPLGDVPAPTMTGAEVRMNLPAGVSHDLWTGAIKAPQLVQPAPNTDFGIEAKWLSSVSQASQLEGLVVKKDATTFIRFDVFRESATTTKAFVATFVNGTATARANVVTTLTAPVYQRVTRTGDSWKYEISGDGATWTTITTFTFAMVVNQVGVFAGNHNPTASKVPAFSALLDYFHNTASPLPDESSIPPGPLANDDFQTFDASRWQFVNPRNGDATFSVSGGDAVISLPGGSGHDHDAYYDTLTVPRLEQRIADADFETEVKFDTAPSLSTPNQIEGLLVKESSSKYVRFDTFTAGDHHEVFAATYDGSSFVERIRRPIRGGTGAFYLRVKRTGSTWTYSYSYDQQRWTPAGSFTFGLAVQTVGPFFGNVPLAGQSFATTPAFVGKIDYVVNRMSPPATEDGVGFPPPAADPAIDVWYGDAQTFGQNGKPQQWVNILGNVADYDGIASASYTINGGAPQPLTLGENDTRLVYPGDFNAEIDYASLAPGTNAVAISATDLTGHTTTHTVQVNNAYTGQAWSKAYDIDWSGVSSISDVAQVVDGQWQLTPNGVRTTTTGYDRLLAVGDNGWDAYDATVDVTVHSLGARDNGVGLVAGWRGATTDDHGVTSTAQPRVGHPFPALGWYSKEVGRLQKLNIYRNWIPQYERRLVEHPTFILSPGLTYTIRWQVQPIDATTSQYSLKIWEAGTTEPTDFMLTTTSARQDGSMVMGAHRADVTFGDVHVTPIVP